MRHTIPLTIFALALGAVAPAQAGDVGIVGFEFQDRDGLHKVQVDVTNKGTAPSSPFYVDLFLDRSSAPGAGAYGELYQYLPALPAGGFQRLHFVVPPQLSGLDLFVVADTDGWVGDTDLSDNLVGGHPSWSPDLAIGRVVAAESGSQTQVTVQVRNVGNADAGWFYVDGFVDPAAPPVVGQYGGQYTQVAGLAAGASIEVDFLVPGPLADRSLHILLDTDTWVDERVETNNSAALQFDGSCLAEFSANLCQAASLTSAEVAAILGEIGIPVSTAEQALIDGIVVTRMAVVAPLAQALIDATAAGAALEPGILAVLDGLTDEEAEASLFSATNLAIVDEVSSWTVAHGLADRLQDVNAAVLGEGVVPDFDDLANTDLLDGVDVVDAKADLLARLGSFGRDTAVVMPGRPDRADPLTVAATAGLVWGVWEAATDPPTGDDVTQAVVDGVSSATYAAAPDDWVDAFAMTPAGEATGSFIRAVAGAIGEAYEAVVDWVVDLFTSDDDPPAGDDDDAAGDDDDAAGDDDDAAGDDDDAAGDDDDSTGDDDDDDDATGDDDDSTGDDDDSTASTSGQCLDAYTEGCAEGNGGGGLVGHPFTRLVGGSRQRANQTDPWWNPAINWGPDGEPIRTGGTISPGDLADLWAEVLNPIINWGPDGPPARRPDIGVVDIVVVDPSVNWPDWLD